MSWIDGFKMISKCAKKIEISPDWNEFWERYEWCKKFGCIDGSKKTLSKSWNFSYWKKIVMEGFSKCAGFFN